MSRNEGGDFCFRTRTLRWYRCLTFGRWLLGTNPSRHKQNLWTCFCFRILRSSQIIHLNHLRFQVLKWFLCILWLGVGMTCGFMSIYSSSPSKFCSESRYCKESKPHSGWSACLKAIMAGFGPAFNNRKPSIVESRPAVWAVCVLRLGARLWQNMTD